MPLLPLIEEGETNFNRKSIFFATSCLPTANRNSEVRREWCIIQKEATEVKWLERKLDLHMD